MILHPFTESRPLLDWPGLFFHSVQNPYVGFLTPRDIRMERAKARHVILKVFHPTNVIQKSENREQILDICLAQLRLNVFD